MRATPTLPVTLDWSVVLPVWRKPDFCCSEIAKVCEVPSSTAGVVKDQLPSESVVAVPTASAPSLMSIFQPASPVSPGSS